MTIGITVNKAQLDNDMGQAAVTLLNAFRRIQELHQDLLVTPDATLIAMGYVQAEVNTIKSAFTDGDNLRQGAGGTIALPQQNYLANLDQLAGDLVT
jgi:hypothetical protein